MKRQFLYLNLLIITSLLVVISGCTPNKNTFTRRSYHNITAHYNAYFNGVENLKGAVSTFEGQYLEDYTHILPVYKYPNEQTAQSLMPAMDLSVKKASKVIQKHSFAKYNKKSVEYCEWIDDSYLLMGKAQFYKRDFSSARTTFNHIISNYKNEPTRYQAMLWNARILMLEGEINKAQSMLENVAVKVSRNEVSKEVSRELPMVYADFHILNGNYSAAVDHLVNALERNKKKSVKVRLYFILGQIYQGEGKYQEATKCYKKVIKLNPAYEMSFHAKINLARCYDSKIEDSQEIRKILMKMLKDEKNKDYKDEIYYALADIARKEKNITETKEFLTLSVNTSTTNNYQKAISALDLADIYFNETDYPNAQAYYDSTMTFLPEKFPNYKEIKNKYEVLSDLVMNLQVVQREDSLQRVAKMSQNERNALIDGIIKKIVEDEQRKQQEEIDRQVSLQYMEQERRQQSVTQTNAQWYFYNPSSLSFGIAEFSKKWGKRKLEDLWRLSDKQVSAFDDPDNQFGDEQMEQGKGDGQAVNLKDRNYYMKDIPSTPEKIAASDVKIAKAIYNLGIIYKEGLKDLDKSIEMFSNFESRFPTDSAIIRVYYNLYRIYLDLGINDKAEKYKNLIKANYPESDYAKIITDPEYFKKAEKSRNQAQEFYTETYLLYLNKDYGKVNQNTEIALKKYTDTEVLAKFEYLNALSFGQKKDTAKLKELLSGIVTKYPKSQVKPAAQNMLDFLTTPQEDAVSESTGQKAKDDKKADPKTAQPLKKYNFDAEAIHLFVAVVEIKNVNMTELKNIFSNHNTQFFSSDSKLTISSLFLDDTHQMLSVSNFKELDKGKSYVKSVTYNKDLMDVLKNANAEYFLISVNNYSAFFKSKDIEEYKAFYKENYSEK